MRRFWIEEPAQAEHTELLLAELGERGWTRTHDADWDLSWSFGLPTAHEYASVGPDQRLNHFPGMVTQHSKDELAFFLERARGHSVTGFDFFPRTFSMPHQFGEWRIAAEEEPSTIWITKPKRGAKGHRVSVVSDIDAVVADPDFIVQEYIATPLVVPEYPHKHIIRVYVAVTSLDPLIAYVHPRTFVRFASRPFGLSAAELADPIRHITNPSVQLQNPELVGGLRIMDWAEFSALLARAGLDAQPLWPRIQAMLGRVLAAHRRPMQTVTERYTDQAGSCFDLLGYDVMIDDQLRPRLIECNMSPLLSVRGAVGSKDRATHELVKRPVIADLLDLVGITANGVLDDRHPFDRFDEDFGRRGEFELLAPSAHVHAVLESLGDNTSLDEQIGARAAQLITSEGHEIR